MKFHFLVVIAAAFLTQSLFAANIDCAKAAGNAALKLAHPQGNKTDSSLFVSIGDTRLSKKSGSRLYYKVEINFDVNDGYSDSFPTETYSVIATGNEQTCRVTGVVLVK